MQIEESFTVDASPEAVWRVFDDIARVARCVPGVQSVALLGPERYKVVATQKVGFVSATFELTTQVEIREPLKLLALSSAGKSVKGAVGNLRSRDRVEFEPTTDGGTRVHLTSDLAVGGMLGALGHKVIASKSKEITEKFAQALRAEIQSATTSGA
jgi:carbon monoxide dehydrogenase subunit G